MTTHQVPTVRLRSLIISQIALFFLVGIMMAVVLVSTDNARDADRLLTKNVASAQIASCERGKKIFAYSIIDAGRKARMPVERQKAAMKLLPLADCVATQKSGKPVLLSPVEKRIYIESVAKILGVTDWDVTDNK